MNMVSTLQDCEDLSKEYKVHNNDCSSTSSWMLQRIPRNAVRFQLGEKQRNLVNLAVAVRLPFCFGKIFQPLSSTLLSLFISLTLRYF
ncbi:hypothetical protein VNO77_03545 [Canavalia gladiata]|uniref:Uncharacterized protein n=1 Tax=Canavalia gladiata TaxID=3824 RepID=A0AAN9N1B5_CANGL